MPDSSSGSVGSLDDLSVTAVLRKSQSTTIVINDDWSKGARLPSSMDFDGSLSAPVRHVRVAHDEDQAIAPMENGLVMTE